MQLAQGGYDVNGSLTEPHGGKLNNLMASPHRAAELKAMSRDLPSWDLTPRQECDVELLLNGGFSPLDGFLCESDYTPVLTSMRLCNGTLWPIPIVLDVDEGFVARVTIGDRIVLRDQEGIATSVMTIADAWRLDRRWEAERVYGSTDPRHPGVAYLLDRTGPVYLGGSLEGLELPNHHSFNHLRRTPAQLRALFAERGWSKVIAFQTRNPMHRAHFEITREAIRQSGANLLIHPVVGMTKPGDIDYYTRVRCYQAILKFYPENSAELSLLPLAMRMAGPREAVWHAIIRKNFGCTHLIVGRAHADPGTDTNGVPFYCPYAAQEMLSRYEDELRISMVPNEEVVYVESEDRYLPVSKAPEGARIVSLSGTDLRRRLRSGEPIPEWFSFPDVIGELRKAYPPRTQQGLAVFFTGLSGAGKSTIARALFDKLMELGGRPVTLLDGDIVRKNLSSELGFSREHRDLNIRRIGFVASEIVKNRGIAIAAAIAPYDAARKEVREMVSQYGGFILVHVNTHLDVCESRDRKGLYAKARAGIIKEFTGISDPYEPPRDAEVVIDTEDETPEEGARAIFEFLRKEGFV